MLLEPGRTLSSLKRSWKSARRLGLSAPIGLDRSLHLPRCQLAAAKEPLYLILQMT